MLRAFYRLRLWIFRRQVDQLRKDFDRDALPTVPKRCWYLKVASKLRDKNEEDALFNAVMCVGRLSNVLKAEQFVMPEIYEEASAFILPRSPRIAVKFCSEPGTISQNYGLLRLITIDRDSQSCFMYSECRENGKTYCIKIPLSYPSNHPDDDKIVYDTGRESLFTDIIDGRRLLRQALKKIQ